jgi:hypothetical protein
MAAQHSCTWAICYLTPQIKSCYELDRNCMVRRGLGGGLGTNHLSCQCVVSKSGAVDTCLW